MSYVGLDDNLTEFGDIFSQELATFIKDNITYIQKSIPVGQVIPILTHIPGVPAPNPNIWQECNGSEITNPNSPLRSTGDLKRFTPDMRDRYIRAATVIGESGQVVGENAQSLSHNHGGQTGVYVTPENADSGGARNVSFGHSHPIGSDLTTPISMEPAFYTVKFFMKIQ